MSEQRERAALVECAICGDSETGDVFRDPTGPARDYPLVRCEKCGLVFQKYGRSKQDLDAAQAAAYARPTRRFHGPFEWLVRGFRMARVRLCERLLDGPGRVLDVGCGRGLFLQLMGRRGHEVRGTELSESTAANAYPDVTVDVGEFRPGRYPPASFDVISIWHVLEHDQQPAAALAAARESLVPGGALVLAVPNYASVQARFGGEDWFHLDLPRHVFQFTPQTLTRLLRDAGFEIETCRTGQWEMDPFGLVQTVLNRAGLRSNSLYDSLRSNRDVRRDLSQAYRLAMLAFLPIGVAMAIPLSLAFRLAGRAGTLIVVARKPAAA
ncbi:MAG: class I SAM-dependent methyltransferase [Deltaproteobacteria bacterium]|nr:class I SAM-dependent methyltransferase [Deltaproteobacteria bacterium]